MNIKEIKEGSIVDGYFAVVDKRLRTFRSGRGVFLQLRLADSTGSIWSRCWENAEEIFSSIDKGDVVHIKGFAELSSASGELEIVFSPTDVEKCPTMDPKEFMKKTDKDVDKLFQELKEIAESIENEPIRNIVKAFFDDDDFVRNFKLAPAAKTYHHNHLGGLLEHTYNVVRICDLLSSLYPELDRDLMIAGAILHDCGKITSYEYEHIIDVSEEGGLMGHIFLGLEMLREKIKNIDIPEEISLKLQHVILSHHIQGRWGSPIEPRFAEANAISYADLMDSRVDEFLRIQKEALEKEEGVWSGYNRALRRFLYLGRRVKEEKQ